MPWTPPSSKQKQSDQWTPPSSVKIQQTQEDPEVQSPSFFNTIKSAYDKAFTPFDWAKKDLTSDQELEEIGQKYGLPNFLTKTAKVAKYGAEVPWDILTSLVGSPGDLASTAVTAGSLGTGGLVKSGLSGLDRALNATSALRGAGQVAEGIGEGNTGQVIGGGLRAALGAIGARAPKVNVPKVNVPEIDVPPIVSKGLQIPDKVPEIPDITKPTPIIPVVRKGKIKADPRLPSAYADDLSPVRREATVDFEVEPDPRLPASYYREPIPKPPPTFTSETPVARQVEEVIKPLPIDHPSKQAASSLSPVLRKIDNFFSSAGKTARYATTESIEQSLHKMGPKGKEIDFLLARTTHEGKQLASRFDQTFEDITKNIHGDDFKNFVYALEGKEAPVSEAVTAAVGRYKAEIDTPISQLGKSGLTTRNAKGESIPWEPRENYVPHKWEPGFIDNNREEIISRVMSQNGVSRVDAEKILQDIRQSSERRISPQYQRLMEGLPGYRTDKGIFVEHFRDMGRRLAEVKNLGKYDIGESNAGKLNPESRLSQAIEELPEGQRQEAADLINKALGRTVEHRNWLGNVNSTVQKAAAVMHLSLFPLSNMAGNFPILVRGTTRDFLGALGNWSRTSDIAKDSGALYNIAEGIVSEGSRTGLIDKAYSVTRSENLLRTIAAGTGHGAAKTFFGYAKKGSMKYAKRLEDLTLEPVEKLLKQDALTEDQLRMAAARFAELTQGLPDARKMPPGWTNQWAQIPLIFQKYAFQNTKIIKDAIKENPGRALPMLATIAPLIGAGVSNIKTGITAGISTVGTSKEKFDEMRKSRNEFVGKQVRGIGYKGKVTNPLTGKASKIDLTIGNVLPEGENIDAYLNGLINSWALGIPADIMMSMGGEGAGILNQLAGVTVNDIKQFFQDPGKKLVTSTPFIGRGLRERLMPYRPPSAGGGTGF